jgi:hypothetical protein
LLKFYRSNATSTSKATVSTSTRFDPFYFPTDAGSAAERDRFHFLQQSFAEHFASFFPDVSAPKTVVIIPSLTIDQEILSKVSGSVYYEERLLCLLMMLRMHARTSFMSPVFL